jgi:hypothetical protein
MAADDVKYGIVPGTYVVRGARDASFVPLSAPRVGTAPVTGKIAAHPELTDATLSAGAPSAPSPRRSKGELTASSILDTGRAVDGVFPGFEEGHPTDGRVLVFRGVFKEGVSETLYGEAWRLRYVVLQCYLKDCTVQLMDPEVSARGSGGGGVCAVGTSSLHSPPPPLH